MQRPVATKSEFVLQNTNLCFASRICLLTSRRLRIYICVSNRKFAFYNTNLRFITQISVSKNKCKIHNTFTFQNTKMSVILTIGFTSWIVNSCTTKLTTLDCPYRQANKIVLYPLASNTTNPPPPISQDRIYCRTMANRLRLICKVPFRPRPQLSARSSKCRITRNLTRQCVLGQWLLNRT